MSEPRDDVYAVAALLTELDRVLHPLARGEGGDFKVDPPLPPSLPTPTSPGRGGEGGRSVKASSQASGLRSARSEEPRGVLTGKAPASVLPVEARAPSMAHVPSSLRRRVPRPEPTLDGAPRSLAMCGTVDAATGGNEGPGRAPIPVDVVHEVDTESPGVIPQRPHVREQDASSVTPARMNPSIPEERSTEVSRGRDTLPEASVPRRTRVPRPSNAVTERQTASQFLRARAPEEAVRRHRVPHTHSHASPIAPVESGPSLSPLPSRRRPYAPTADLPPTLGERTAPVATDEPRHRPRLKRPEAEASRSPPPSRDGARTPPPPATRSTGRPTSEPVRIEVKTLVPPLGAEAAHREVMLEEERSWEELPDPETDAGAPLFFVNGRRVTREDHEALRQAEQRLRRRMTGRSLWRRRG
ncbi:hypothetical protein COSO111634_29270 [Corallococcus soli]